MPFYRIPSPTPESRELTAQLDKMSAEYAAILGENYRARKAEYFEKCRALAEKLHRENKITIYAGDSDFEKLYSAIGKETTGHLAAITIFCTDSESFYIIGVCINSTPLFRRMNESKDDIDARARDRWGKLGVYFEGEGTQNIL